MPSRLRAAVLILSICLAPHSLRADTNVPSGTITTDTTWDLSGSPFIVACGGLTVASGVTLTISAGVVVKFQLGSGFCGPAFISINGTVIANGNPTQNILFTSVLDGS